MRRENFFDTVAHRAPQKMTVDFGGCPLSTADGAVIAKMKDFLGFYGNDEDERLPFAATASIDERILRAYDIDTRGVGYILAPKKSLYRKIDDTAYVDEWGVTRKFTGLYWDIVDSPLKDADLKDVENYPFPDPDSIDVKALDAIKRQAKYLYENTDYVICASHPVYGIFELGCWMFGFDDFLYRMAAEPEVVHCFFERVLAYQKQVSDLYYGAIGDYIHYTSSGDDFATQSSTFFSKTMFDEMILPYFKERALYQRKDKGEIFTPFVRQRVLAHPLAHRGGRGYPQSHTAVQRGYGALQTQRNVRRKHRLSRGTGHAERTSARQRREHRQCGQKSDGHLPRKRRLHFRRRPQYTGRRERGKYPLFPASRKKLQIKKRG